MSVNRYLITTSALVLAGATVLATPAVASAPARTVATGTAWGQAEEVPGTAALNASGNGPTSSVSCASPGNCSAGGYYTTDKAHNTSGAGQEAFIVSQT